MQADVDRTRSRAFNVFLRQFHLGLRLIVAIVSTRLFQQYDQCMDSFDRFAFPSTIGLVVLNISFIVYLECCQKKVGGFPNYAFFICLCANVVLSSVMLLLTYSMLTNKSVCTQNQILQTYLILEILIGAVVCAVALLAPFTFAQRYTNTPGNLAWSIILIMFMSSLTFNVQMQIITWLNALVCVSSLMVNMTALVQGISPTLKKVILVEWVLSLIVLMICMFISVVTFFNNFFLDDYENEVLRNMTTRFISITALDIGFWIWGLLTLTYDNGDLIRDAVMYKNYSAEYENELEIGENSRQQNDNLFSEGKQSNNFQIQSIDNNDTQSKVKQQQRKFRKFHEEWLDIRYKR